MQSALRWSQVLTLLLLLWLGRSGAAGALDTFTLREVTPGLKGTGYTVVQGTKVEPFDVEILGVLEEAGPGGDLLLVRVDGDAIERTGGIAAGMSGSPVLVEGRLLGAIGYGFELSDHRIGLVTPAEEMRAVLELARKAANADAATTWAESPALPERVHVVASRDEARRVAAQVGADEWVAAPVATPLVVSGLGGRAMSRLKGALSRFDLIPVQGGSGASNDSEEAPFEAGSALGVQLMRGDIEVTAIGTVTAVDESGVFIAFGHPLMHRGDVRYFTTGAYILYTVPSISIPFKLAIPLAPVGTITQDRGAAVAGHLGSLPPAVELEVRVLDTDRSEPTSLKAEIVRDEALFSTLAVIGALEGIDRSLDRIGGGTSRVSFRIEGSGIPELLSRENMFYSAADVAAASLSEFWEALELIEGNEFASPGLTRVELSVEVEAARRTASIEEARPAKRRVAPGSVVDVHVRLRPYRQDPVQLVVPMSIPEEIGEGPLTVSVRAGGDGSVAEVPTSFDEELPGGAASSGEDESGEASEGLTRAQSLENLIREFHERTRNHDLVLEFYPTEPAYRESEDSTGDASDGELLEEEHIEAYGYFEPRRYDDGPDPVRTVRETEYVLHGEAYFTLIVEEKPPKPEEEPDPIPAPSRSDAEPGRGPYPLEQTGLSGEIRKSR